MNVTYTQTQKNRTRQWTMGQFLDPTRPGPSQGQFGGKQSPVFFNPNDLLFG